MTAVVKPPTHEQMQQQIAWLERENERLRAMNADMLAVLHGVEIYMPMLIEDYEEGHAVRKTLARVRAAITRAEKKCSTEKKL